MHYSGPGTRLAATALDFLMLLPFGILAWHLAGRSLPGAVTGGILMVILRLIWILWFQAKTGRTPGKLLAGITVVDPRRPGQAPGLAVILKRESVETALQLLRVAGLLLAARAMGSQHWFVEDWSLLGDRFNNLNPFAQTGTFILVWAFAECLFVLSNRHRRSLHDLIGGTVVVRTGPFRVLPNLLVAVALLLAAGVGLRFTGDHPPPPEYEILSGRDLTRASLKTLVVKGLTRADDTVAFAHTSRGPYTVRTVLTERALIRRGPAGRTVWRPEDLRGVRRRYDFGGRVDLLFDIRPDRGSSFYLQNLTAREGKKLQTLVRLTRKGRLPLSHRRNLARLQQDHPAAKGRRIRSGL